MALARKQTPKGERARRQILDAVEELFVTKGFFGTSVREAAAKAGVPSASLLHHFPTKEALYRALLDRIAEDLDSFLTPTLSPPPTDQRIGLRNFCVAYLDWTEQKPHYSSILLREMLDNSGRMQAAKHLPMAKIVDLVRSFLREGARLGIFRPIDPFVFICHMAGSASYFTAARPTITRLSGVKDLATITKAHRQTLLSILERAVLVDPGDPGG